MSEGDDSEFWADIQKLPEGDHQWTMQTAQLVMTLLRQQQRQQAKDLKALEMAHNALVDDLKVPLKALDRLVWEMNLLRWVAVTVGGTAGTVVFSILKDLFLKTHT